MKRGAAPPSISREVSPLEEVHLDIFTFNGRCTVYLIDRGSRAEFTYSLDKKSDLPKALQQFLIDYNTASFPVGSFVHAGENDSDSLNKFLTRLGIRHLSSIAECRFQNGLAENGG